MTVFASFRDVGKVPRWLLLRAIIGLSLLQGTEANAQQGPSGGYLLRKAEMLEAAKQYDAASTAYHQANAAFKLANDQNGQLRTLAQLAALEEKRANDKPMKPSSPSAVAGQPNRAKPPVKRAK